MRECVYPPERETKKEQQQQVTKTQSDNLYYLNEKQKEKKLKYKPIR